MREKTSWSESTAVLRLDSIEFPPGAIAYLHDHPGPGIRYLTRGRLEIKAEDHSKMMHPGDTWFEDARSPVEAVAGISETTQFVRAHILPMQFAGKPTINYLRPEDAERPKLQINHRHFDQVIKF